MNPGFCTSKSKWCIAIFNIFLNVDLTNLGHLLDHLLWLIFQSVVSHSKLIYALKTTLHSVKYPGKDILTRILG